MKTKLSFLLFNLILNSCLIAQGDDLQWLIMKGIGKDGVDPANTSKNKYSNSFSGVTEFNLEGVTHPNIPLYNKNKNDVFIIYSDNTFFSSRIKDPNVVDNGFFYSSDLSINKHHLSTPNGKTMQYLYLTNIYEGDDPPHRVKAYGAGALQDPHPGFDDFNIPPGSATPAQALSANHDVVRNKDITLILDNQKIKEALDYQGTDLEYEVRFNKVYEKANHANFSEEVFFTPREIFSPSSGQADVAIYPSSCGSYNSNTNVITIDNVQASDFVYINLRPTTLLIPFYPGINGVPVYEAEFSISSQDSPGFNVLLNEDIRSAHDPNQLRIDSICQLNPSSDFIVFCHLEFENTSPQATNDIKASFKLPGVADQNCLEIIEWFIGGSTEAGTCDVTNGNAKLVFPKINIQKCNQTADKTPCSGYVNFKFKINASVNVKSLGTKILPTTANVFFDGQRFRVTRLDDLLDYIDTGSGLNPIPQRPIHIKRGCSIHCTCQ